MFWVDNDYFANNIDDGSRHITQVRVNIAL